LARALSGKDVDQAVLFAPNVRSQQGAWVNMTARPLRDETGAVKGAVLVLADITLQKRRERVLSQARDGAERTARAKGDFVSRMSHELRTKLNALLGFAQSIETARLKPRQRDNVANVVRAGHQLLSLVDDVADVSRIESGRLALASEPVPATDLMREALALVEAQASAKQIRINWELVAGADLCVRADRQRLAQVLLNLLRAAIEYNRPSSAIALSCQETAKRRVRIQISDSGVPPEKADLMFRPFERLGAGETEGEANGAGLLLSKRLIEAMDGTIDVESNANAGTTIRVELPAAVPPAKAPERPCTDDLAAAAGALLDAQIASLLGIEAPRRKERQREPVG
jgi:signal transduction histidine kinase